MEAPDLLRPCCSSWNQELRAIVRRLGQQPIRRPLDRKAAEQVARATRAGMPSVDGRETVPSNGPKAAAVAADRQDMIVNNAAEGRDASSCASPGRCATCGYIRLPSLVGVAIRYCHRGVQIALRRAPRPRIASLAQLLSASCPAPAR